MTENVQRQNKDGSYSQAEPLGWQGKAIDWEVYDQQKPMMAVLYDKDQQVGVVLSKNKRILHLKMIMAEARYRYVR